VLRQLRAERDLHIAAAQKLRGQIREQMATLSVHERRLDEIEPQIRRLCEEGSLHIIEEPQ
jgi:uncharacterized coiled-coil DUF342 family protein